MSESFDLTEDCLMDNSEEEITPSAIVEPKIQLVGKKATDGQP